MARIFRNKNPNMPKISIMVAAQALLAGIPVLLMVVYVWRIGGDNYVVGIIFIGIMLLMLALYMIVARRYRILLSGYRGERALLKLIRKMRLRDTTLVFSNLPIHYKRNRSEIDLLIVGEKGVLIIEVKNHAGTISGNDNDETWLQRKVYKNGRVTETQMANPFRQIKRQREILKSILRAGGHNVWVDNLLYFSNPSVHLQLDLHANNYVCGSEAELVRFVSEYQPKIKLSPAECRDIAQVLKDQQT